MAATKELFESALSSAASALKVAQVAAECLEKQADSITEVDEAIVGADDICNRAATKFQTNTTQFPFAAQAPPSVAPFHANKPPLELCGDSALLDGVTGVHADEFDAKLEELYRGTFIEALAEARRAFKERKEEEKKQARGAAGGSGGVPGAQPRRSVAQINFAGMRAASVQAMRTKEATRATAAVRQEH